MRESELPVRPGLLLEVARRLLGDGSQRRLTLAGMTVPVETSEVTYTGNGVTASFSTGFYFLQASELRVLLTPVGGSPTLQVEGPDYSVTMPGGVGVNGSVVMSTPPATGAVLTVRRQVPLTQLTSFRAAGSFAPAVHEDQFDELLFIDQQLARRITALESAGAPGAVVAGDGLEFVDSVTLAVLPGEGLELAAGLVQVNYSDTSPPEVDADNHAPGTSAKAARFDHQHLVVTAAPDISAVRVGNAVDIGASPALARADHRHEVLAGVPVNVTKAAAAEGNSMLFARANHKHDITTAAAIGLTDTTNAEGSATSLARSDHTHAHGARGGGTLHAEAVAGGAAGFLSGPDKAGLDEVLSLTGRSHVRAHRSTAQSIPNSTLTQVVWNTETNDALAEYNHATGRFTAAAAGYYAIHAQLEMDIVALVATNRLQLLAQVNGTDAIYTHEDYVEASVTRRLGCELHGTVYMAAGQYLEIHAYQVTGAALSTYVLGVPSASSFFTVDRIA